VKRRNLITVLAGAAAYPLLAGAQQKSVTVIGYLGGASPGAFAPFVAAFRQGLNETGFVERQNVAIEYRWAEGQFDRLPSLAADLAGRKVDVIATSGGDRSALAAKTATQTIPIVFVVGADPVETGLVASVARPAGNLTGFSLLVIELTPKLFELSSEIVPQTTMVAALVNPSGTNSERVIQSVQEAARAKGMQLVILRASTASEIDAALSTLAQQQAQALVVLGDPFFYNRRQELAELVARHAVPAIYSAREFVTAGGLISYGTNIAAVHRQAGIYAGRILKGAKPANLPVQQPTTFELVINLKTAKALGLTVPQSILARADEVIE
jgi:putative ABC transport system substrate-binding protein